MQRQDWQLRDECPRDDVEALVRELSVSETLAAVLVRRGYADADRARAFLAAEPPEHDPFLLGDMEGACEAIRRAIAEGKRICVHASSARRSRGICRAASTRATASRATR
jgi:single-stranded-DNA-specific exonuclease